jgi:hypothetical protein
MANSTSNSVIVLVASFLSHVLQYGIVWTVGVYHVIFLEVFESGNAVTALVGSLNTASYYCAGKFTEVTFLETMH